MTHASATYHSPLLIAHSWLLDSYSQLGGMMSHFSVFPCIYRNKETKLAQLETVIRELAKP